MQRHYEESDVEGLAMVKVRMLFSQGEEITEEAVKKLLEDLRRAVSRHDVLFTIEAGEDVTRRVRAASAILAFEKEMDDREAGAVIFQAILNENAVTQHELGLLLMVGRSASPQGDVSRLAAGKARMKPKLAKKLILLQEEGRIKISEAILRMVRTFATP